MFKSASFLAALAILGFLSMAPFMCVEVHSDGYVPHPVSVLAMSPQNLGDYGFTYVSDTLIDGYDVAGYTFDTDDPSVVIVSCTPDDVYMDPVVDLYEYKYGDPHYFATERGSGFFTYGTTYHDDALVIFDSDTTFSTFDAVVSPYRTSTYGDFTLTVAAIPYNDTYYLGSRRRDGLVGSDTYKNGTLPDAVTTHFYYFSVNWGTGAPVVLYLDSNYFNTSLILRGLDGTLIAEGTLVSGTGYTYSAEIDDTISGLDPGTYILEVSSDDANSGNYRVGIDF